MTIADVQGQTKPVMPIGPKRRKWMSAETKFGLAMITPALLTLITVLLYPSFVALQSSFYRIQTVSRKETFVGLDNYYKVLTDPEFWMTLQRTVIWAVGAISTQVVAGVLIAMVLHKPIKGRAFIRGMILFPYLVPAIVAVLIWRWAFSGEVGVVNWLLVDKLGILSSPIPWFDPGWVMVAIIIMSLWKYLPYWALFVLARLQTLPPELIDAAKIDGATKFQQFRYITLPWILPVVIVLLVLRTIWAFNEFDMVYLPAGGGPLNETTTIPVYIRMIAFEYGDIGHAAAVAVIMLFLVAGLSNFYFWIYKRAEKRLS